MQAPHVGSGALDVVLGQPLVERQADREGQEGLGRPSSNRPCQQRFSGRSEPPLSSVVRTRLCAHPDPAWRPGSGAEAR